MRSAVRRPARRTGGRPKSGISASMPGIAANRKKRADRAPDPAAADQYQALAALGELVAELRRHAPSERMTDHRGPVDLQHAEQIAHAVGISGHRIVGSWFLRTPVAEQVRSHDGVMPGKLVEYRPPGVGTVADPVDQEERRPLSVGDVSPPISVDRAELHRVIGFSPNAGLGANLSGVDGSGVGIVRRTRLEQWTRHAIRQPTFKGAACALRSMVRIGGIRLVTAM